ncbi:MAG: MraY family glycosyltransferase [Candidatus Cloacimonetes bacterium]|nr:MraY family glycosyltransferase [Candidatus Cloacimonadota bacterium]
MNPDLVLPIALLSLGIHLLTHLLVPLNIKLSTKFGILAQPGERKIHTEAKPEAGGLSFALPLVLAQVVLGLTLLPDLLGTMLLQLAGVEVIALILGVLDDRYDTKAWLKFLLQLLIGVVMYFIGFRVVSLTNPFGAEIILHWASFPITLLWYLVVMNAINLIDGIDGLASGVCVIVCGVLLSVGIKEQNLLVTALSAFLLAGNLAFLGFNFHPAKIFLGDTGALFNGLVIAAVSTAGTQQYKGITSMTLIIPLAVLAVPLIDMALAVLRRLRLGNIFVADKAHLHHAMLGLGLSQRAIALIAYVVTLLFGLIAIGFSFSTKRILFSVLLGLLILGVILAYVLMRQGRKK